MAAKETRKYVGMAGVWYRESASYPPLKFPKSFITFESDNGKFQKLWHPVPIDSATFGRKLRVRRHIVNFRDENKAILFFFLQTPDASDLIWTSGVEKRRYNMRIG